MRIGEYLRAIGVLTEKQVDEIISLQKKGDTRKFGEIAVSRGFMEDNSITRFTNFLSENQNN